MHLLNERSVRRWHIATVIRQRARTTSPLTCEDNCHQAALYRMLNGFEDIRRITACGQTKSHIIFAA